MTPYDLNEIKQYLNYRDTIGDDVNLDVDNEH